MKLRTLLTLCAITAFTLSACSDDNNRPPSIPQPTNNTPDKDMKLPDKDMGDMKDDKDLPDSATDMADMPDMTTPGGTDLCSNVQKLGTIAVADRTESLSGSTLTIDGMDPLISGVGTACGGQVAAEQVFEFQVDQPVRITANLKAKDNTAWVLEARTGTCQASETLYCSANTASYVFVAQPGKTYYLVAEPQRQDKTGAFDLDLKLTPLVCLPVGGTTCAGTDVSLCEAGGEAQITYACGAPCSQDHCGGDLCDNAISVTAGTFRINGAAKAYKNTFDFKDSVKCVNPDTAIQPEMGEPIPDPGSPGNISTPGQDVVFKLPGLKKDQKVTVDATTDAGDNADSAIFVLNSCDVLDCRVGLDIGDKLDAWTVPADGDYFIVVDRVRSSDQEIVVDIKIE